MGEGRVKVPRTRKPALRPPEARNAIVEANMGLCGHILKSFSKDYIKGVGGYEEAVSIVYSTLIDSADYWDDTRGISFSTYACVAMRRAILDAAHRGYAKYHALIELSLDNPDVLRALSIVPPEAPCEWRESREKVRECVQAGLDKLEPRIAEMCMARVAGEKLSSIGRRYGVSKERVRQLVMRGFRILREEIPEEACEYARA